MLHEFPIVELEVKTIRQIRFRDGPPVDGENFRFAIDDSELERGVGLIAQRHRAIIRDVKIERAVAIQIGERHRTGAPAAVQRSKR